MTAPLVFWVGLMVIAASTGALLFTRSYPEVFGRSGRKSIIITAGYAVGGLIVLAGLLILLQR